MGALRLVAERDVCQIILKQMENFDVDEGNEGERERWYRDPEMG